MISVSSDGSCDLCGFLINSKITSSFVHNFHQSCLQSWYPAHPKNLLKYLHHDPQLFQLLSIYVNVHRFSFWLTMSLAHCHWLILRDSERGQKVAQVGAHPRLLTCNFFRWQGPLSIAVFAPGTDFKKAIDSILYFRFLLILIVCREYFWALKIYLLLTLKMQEHTYRIVAVLIFAQKSCAHWCDVFMYWCFCIDFWNWLGCLKWYSFACAASFP